MSYLCSLIEMADMVTMQAAQRLIGVHMFRREALADAARSGRVLTDVVERSVRLEIAAALRITEHEAAAMVALGEALVERFPTVLDSFACARMTQRHARFLVEAVQTVEPVFPQQILPEAVSLAEGASAPSNGSLPRAGATPWSPSGECRCSERTGRANRLHSEARPPRGR